MAFTKTNLRVLEDGTIGALATGKLWKYVVPASDDIETEGYFTSDTGMGAGDVVLAIDSTPAYGFYGITAADGVLTAAQMSEVSGS